MFRSIRWPLLAIYLLLLFYQFKIISNALNRQVNKQIKTTFNNLNYQLNQSDNQLDKFNQNNKTNDKSSFKLSKFNHQASNHQLNRTDKFNYLNKANKHLKRSLFKRKKEKKTECTTIKPTNIVDKFLPADTILSLNRTRLKSYDQLDPLEPKIDNLDDAYFNNPYFSNESIPLSPEYFGNFFRRFRQFFLRIHGHLSLFVCSFGIIANILNIIVLTR